MNANISTPYETLPVRKHRLIFKGLGDSSLLDLFYGDMKRKPQSKVHDLYCSLSIEITKITILGSL